MAALVLGFVALGSADALWCAIPMGICASFLAIGAVTGWCPTDLLALRRRAGPNRLGYAEVRDVVTLERR